MINKNMKDPVQKAAKLKALNEFEKMMFGDSGITEDTDDIFTDRLDLTLPTGITDTTFQNFLAFKNLTEPKTGIETIPDKKPDTDIDVVGDPNKIKEMIEEERTRERREAETAARARARNQAVYESADRQGFTNDRGGFSTSRADRAGTSAGSGQFSPKTSRGRSGY